MKRLFRPGPLGLGLLLTCTGLAFAQPQLRLSTRTIDFGYAPQKAHLRTHIYLHSSGLDTLHIIRVIPGCACTRTELEHAVIPPGDSARLDVTFATRRYLGAMTRRPSIQFEGSEVVGRFAIETNIYRPEDSTFPLVLSPPLIAWRDTATLADTVVIRATNLGTDDISPRVVFGDSALVWWQLPSSIPAGETALWRIASRDLDQDAEYQTSLTIELDNRERTRITIPILRHIPGGS